MPQGAKNWVLRAGATGTLLLLNTLTTPSHYHCDEVRRSQLKEKTSLATKIPIIISYFDKHSSSLPTRIKTPPIHVLCNRHLRNELTGLSNLSPEDRMEYQDFPQEMYTEETWKLILSEVKSRLYTRFFTDYYPPLTPRKCVLMIDADAHLGYYLEAEENRRWLDKRLKVQNLEVPSSSFIPFPWLWSLVMAPKVPIENDPLVDKYISRCAAFGFAELLQNLGVKVKFDFFELVQNQTVSDNTLRTLFRFSREDITTSHVKAVVASYRPQLLEHYLSLLGSEKVGSIQLESDELLSFLVMVEESRPFLTRAIHCFDVMKRFGLIDVSPPTQKLRDIFHQALAHNHFHLVERLFDHRLVDPSDVLLLFPSPSLGPKESAFEARQAIAILQLYSEKLNRTIGELNQDCQHQLLVKAAQVVEEAPSLLQWLLLDCGLIYQLWRLGHTEILMVLKAILALVSTR
jgi:hypothetical protein